MKTGVELIAHERQRQVRKEGWTAAHDDKHTKGEIAQAARVYADPMAVAPPGTTVIYPSWPWEQKWFKPGSRIKNLIKAGALIAAEIDRLQRAMKSAKEKAK